MCNLDFGSSSSSSSSRQKAALKAGTAADLEAVLHRLPLGRLGVGNRNLKTAPNTGLTGFQGNADDNETEEISPCITRSCISSNFEEAMFFRLGSRSGSGVGSKLFEQLRRPLGAPT